MILIILNKWAGLKWFRSNSKAQGKYESLGSYYAVCEEAEEYHFSKLVTYSTSTRNRKDCCPRAGYFSEA